MATFTVSNKDGVAADGMTINSAAAWFNALGTGTHYIIIRGGTYNEGGAGGIGFGGLGGRILVMYFIDGATLDGKGTLKVGLKLWEGSTSFIYGIKVINYTQYAVFLGNSISSYSGVDARFYDSYIEGRIFTERGRQVLFQRSKIKYGGIDWSTNGNSSVLGFVAAKDCTFQNLSPVMPFNDWADAAGIKNFENNVFKDCDVVINVNDWIAYRTSNQGSKLKRKAFVFSNCRFKAVNDATPSPNTFAWVSCNSLTELNAYIASRALTPALIILDDEVEFRASYELDAYSFSSSEANYIKLKAKGDSRFAVSGNNFTLNPDFLIESGKAKRNVTTPATLELLFPALPQARIARRIALHTTSVAGTTEVITSLMLSISRDGVNYDAPFEVKSGLQEISAGVYNYIFIKKRVKAAKLLITISGENPAHVGQTEVGGASLEMYAAEDIFAQTAGRVVRKQRATGPGCLLRDGYKFKMPLELRQYFTDPAKENYSHSEITAAASAAAISIITDKTDTTRIAAVTVQTPTKTKTVLTFDAL